MSSPEQEIQQVLSTSTMVEELRAGFDDITESRNVFQMDGQGAATNFVITQLATEQCFAVPPFTLSSPKARTAIAIHYIGPGMAGHPGIVHGGAIATIFDECCGKAAVAHFEALHNEEAPGANPNGRNASFDPRKGVVAVTAQLSIDFKSPTRSDAVVMTRATADQEKSSPRKAIVTAQMWQAAPGASDNLQLVASANGLFIRPRATD